MINQWDRSIFNKSFAGDSWEMFNKTNMKVLWMGAIQNSTDEIIEF